MLLYRLAYLLFHLDSDYPFHSLFSFPTCLWKFIEFVITVFAIVLAVNYAAGFVTHVYLFLLKMHGYVNFASKK